MVTCFTVLDLLIKDYLFKVSLPILKVIRNQYSNKTFDVFFQIVSEFGDKYILSLFVAVSYMTMDLPKSFTVALNANTALALLSILKSVNHEARPFHVTDIVPSKCRFEYGNPSGHSLITSSLYLTFCEMLCRQ